MIDTVFVDVDNTLLDFHACARESMTLALAERGVTCTGAMFDTFTRINNGLWEALERGELTREALYAVRFNKVFAALGLSLDGTEFEMRFRENLTVSAVPTEGAEALLAYLHEKYTVCVATNGPQKQQLSRLARAGLLKYVHHLCTSEAMGAEKPSAAFFEACFARMPGARPETSVMIGDSLTADVRGAQNFGIGTIWFNPAGETAAGIQPDYTVRSLAEIRNIL